MQIFQDLLTMYLYLIVGELIVQTFLYYNLIDNVIYSTDVHHQYTTGHTDYFNTGAANDKILDIHIIEFKVYKWQITFLYYTYIYTTVDRLYLHVTVIIHFYVFFRLFLRLFLTFFEC